jgi:hypothetical protein
MSGAVLVVVALGAGVVHEAISRPDGLRVASAQAPTTRSAASATKDFSIPYSPQSRYHDTGSEICNSTAGTSMTQLKWFAAGLMAMVTLQVAHAQGQVLAYECSSRDVTGDLSPPYFEVNLATAKVSFPKGNPPRTVAVDIQDNEFAFIVPYNYYEVKIDRRSGLVLTRSNRRIWAENGTCKQVK